MTSIDACSNYLQLAEQGTPVSAPEGYDSGDYEDYEATPGENFGVSFLMALGISCVISIIICLLLLLKMHTVHQKTEANDYVSEKLKLSRKEDRYTHTTQTICSSTFASPCSSREASMRFMITTTSMTTLR